MNACVHNYTKPQTSSTRNRGLGRRIHGSVEDTKLSTNKQHTLSYDPHSHVTSLQISGVRSTGRVFFFETLGRSALTEGFADVLLKSDEKEGSQAVVTVTAFNGAGLNTSSLITFIFDNHLPVFVGKTILDCCTVHPCHDGDMNFTSNDGLLKGCWMKHHFVQNISGISNFESRLDKYRMDTTRSQNPHPMCLISSPGAIWAEILPAGQSV